MTTLLIRAFFIVYESQSIAVVVFIWKLSLSGGCFAPAASSPAALRLREQKSERFLFEFGVL